MQFDRDLCFFDLETTGIDLVHDRIVQIALIKYPKDGSNPQERNYFVNPEQAIKPEAQAIHGLSAETLAKHPPFRLLAVELLHFIGDADLAGYNSNRFDLPILLEEFARVGLSLSMQNRRFFDAMQIFYKMEPRTLKAAYRFYCNKELEQAHDALADTRATAAIFFQQLQRYRGQNLEQEGQTFPDNPQTLFEFTHDPSRVDFAGRFVRNTEGIILFNFGAKRGEPAHAHPQVLQWIIDRDFPHHVKQLARDILKGKLR